MYLKYEPQRENPANLFSLSGKRGFPTGPQQYSWSQMLFQKSRCFPSKDGVYILEAGRGFQLHQHQIQQKWDSSG